MRCEECSCLETCKYTEEFKKYYDSVNLTSKFADIFKVAVSCKYFKYKNQSIPRIVGGGQGGLL